MTFSITEIAREYIYRRYPKASVPEKEKYVRDWSNKMKDSFALVADFKARAGNPEGKKILDVGCGNGGVSIAFALSGAEVSGVEIEDELYKISIEHARSLSADPDFYLYDGQRLPFEDATFDFAVSVSVIEHTDDARLYLAEILRVIKPGGRLYLGFPNKWWPKETHTGLDGLTYLPQFLRPLYIALRGRNPLPDNNLHFYSYFDLEKMIKNTRSDFMWHVVEEEGTSRNPVKKGVRKILKFFRLPYKAFLPHILVILEKEKNEN